MSQPEYKTVGDIVFGSPTFRFLASQLDCRGLDQFPGIAARTQSDDALLLLPYVSVRPCKLYNAPLYTEAFALMRDRDARALSVACLGIGDELDSALRELRQLNVADDDSLIPLKAEEVHQQELHRRVLHPYVRLAEYVYDSLLSWFLAIRVMQDSKPAVVPRELSARYQMARKRLARVFTDSYSTRRRNAIVHGGVRFAEHDVLFEDKGVDSETVSYPDVISMYNRLLDDCNAMAASIAHRVALGHSGQLEHLLYFRGERVIVPATTPLYTPLSCSIVAREPSRLQVAIFGRHKHWYQRSLLFDVVRTLVLARRVFSEVADVFVDFHGPRDTPCFFSVPAAKIPDVSAPLADLTATTEALAKGGFAWLEHERIVPALLSRVRPVGPALNWLESVDQNMDFSGSSPNYELRHLKNNSTGWRARFDASVVSFPRAKDLDDATMPTKEYLDFLFQQTIFRWAIRRGEPRQFGMNRLRIFWSGIVHVYAQDARLSELINSGLSSNFLFAFERPVRAPVIRAFWQGTVLRIAQYYVAVNPNATGRLRSVKLKSSES